MNLNNFKLDENIISQDCTESYTQIDNEDNFIEFITPEFAENLTVVQYYKSCSRVRTQIYDVAYLNETDINTTIEKIYGKMD